MRPAEPCGGLPAGTEFRKDHGVPMPAEDKEIPYKQATDWLLELSESPEDADLRARLDAWRMACPENATAWEETTRVYGVIGQSAPVHTARWAPVPARMPRASSRPASLSDRHPGRRASRLRIAAVAALAACLAVIVAPKAWLWLRADFTSAIGEVRSVALVDGSTVVLAADSAIGVAFDGGRRQVRLLKGEAFFEVKPDRGRPFTVVTDEAETTVLGTAFEVRQGNAATEVAVSRGQVRVNGTGAHPSPPERLGAGDAVRVAADGHALRAGVAPGNVAAWMSGQMLAENRTVRETVDELSRYFAGMIVLTDEALGRQRLTGVYNLADPAAALRAVARAHNATVRQISPWLLILSPGKAIGKPTSSATQNF